MEVKQRQFKKSPTLKLWMKKTQTFKIRRSFQFNTIYFHGWRLRIPRAYMDVSKYRGKTPQNGMVKIMVPNPMNKWDDLGGLPPLFLVQHPYGSWRQTNGQVFLPPTCITQVRGAASQTETWPPGGASSEAKWYKKTLEVLLSTIKRMGFQSPKTSMILKVWDLLHQQFQGTIVLIIFDFQGIYLHEWRWESKGH